MTSISNVDRLVLLLRQRLEQKAKGAPSKARTAEGTVGGLSAAKALAALADVDQRQVRRALIQGILSDQFGAELVNESRFQNMVDQVVRIMETDTRARSLLDQVTAELK